MNNELSSINRNERLYYLLLNSHIFENADLIALKLPPCHDYHYAIMKVKLGVDGWPIMELDYCDNDKFMEMFRESKNPFILSYHVVKESEFYKGCDAFINRPNNRDYTLCFKIISNMMSDCFLTMSFLENVYFISKGAKPSSSRFVKQSGVVKIIESDLSFMIVSSRQVFGKMSDDYYFKKLILTDRKKEYKAIIKLQEEK